VEITNDGKGNISILSSVPATSLDLKAGVLNVNGEQVKLTGDDIQAITHGKGIIFNVDHEPDPALRASPAPLPPPQNPAPQREISR
jgi:hypothetical protein